MAKSLVINLDEFQTASDDLQAAIDDMADIQKKLAETMKTLLGKDAWHSDGSSAFNDKFEESWVEGIKDRLDVMKRLKDHIDLAKTTYDPIVQECEEIKLQFNL